MPKIPPQDKKSIPEKYKKPRVRSARAGNRAAPQSLAGIMQEHGWLQGLQQVRGVQQEWLEWLGQALPQELRASIVNVVRRGDRLTVLAVSAGWSARLRYALAALAPQLQARAPDIVKVNVRVAPAGRRS